MAQQRPFQRGNPDGYRLQFGGMNTVNPPDQMPPNKYPYAQNVRSYVRQRVGPRAAQDAAVLTAAGSVHSIRRLNDSTLAAGGGEGGPSGSFFFSPSVLNFGSVPQNVLAELLIEITFIGSGAGILHSVTLSNSQFQLLQMPTLPYSFNSGDFTGWYVGINQPVGSYNTVMTVTTSVGAYTVNVTANVVAGNVTISPTQLNFPSTAVGSTSAPQAITVTNNEPVPVELGGYSFTSAPFTPSSDYAFSPQPNFPQTIAPGQSLTFYIVATPQASGTGLATLTILTNLVGVQATVALSMAATFWLSPNVLNFGTVPQNSSAQLLIELLFMGQGPATLNSVSLSNASFQLLSMPGLPYTFNGGGFAGWYVGLNQPAGSYSAVMTIVTSLGTYTVNVTGTTVAANVVVSPTALTFPSTPVGGTSASQTIIVTNNEPANVDLGGYSIQSAPFTPSSDFAFSPVPPFPQTIAPNQSLVFHLVATPTAAGSRTATLTILTSISGVQVVVSLSTTATRTPTARRSAAPGLRAAGPPLGYVLIAGASSNLWLSDVVSAARQIDTGYSGNPLSLLPFRPNASPQPWMYVGDLGKMTKVRSDGIVYRGGIQEPQTAPQTQIVPASDVISTVGPITVTYWGDSPHTGPVGNYIWKHASDTTGSGPVRATTPAAGSTTGNSVIFDVPAFAGLPLPNAFASKDSPMLWFQYETYNGLVSTTGDGTQVVWNSGDQFGGLVAGDQIIIGGISYTIAPSPPPTNTTLNITVSAGIQENINYSAAIVGGPIDLFQPPLESEGFADFNFVLTGTLYVPFAGNYTFYWQSKDETLFGIGNSGVGLATWHGPSSYPGSQLSSSGQTVTAINGYPLLPKTITVQSGSTGGQYNNGGHYVGGSVAAGYSGVVVNFSQPGNYPFEIDYDYWYHSGRILHLEVTGPNQQPGTDLPPLPLDVITNASYRYTYRSSATGATSNPSPESTQQNFSVLSTNVIPTLSSDPQVDKIDIYRMDSGLLSFTYVGTIPNIAPPTFSDKLLDADVSGNPVLQFDNFEPFPSIDLPRSGIANVLAGGILQAMTGDAFNVRWLPGTIILVGTTAFTLNTRPVTGTQLTCSNVDVIQGIEQVVYPVPATGVSWSIQEPILAAQRLPYLWGPTDNVSFFFACGDPLRPGTLYWSKGNQPDSAPDTNQQDVTSPSEPLMNGCITNGLGMVFSTERAWIIIPNFFNAQATVEGTIGSTWTLQETISNRGLYMPWCLAVDGGGNVYFRAKDGIYVSPSGQGSQSITDLDLFNLFPHEGVTPQAPITIGVAPNAYTVYPPDDSQPAAQNLHFANGYLYYDYRDVNGMPRTLVFDVAAGGWVVDVYADSVRTHVLEEGIVNGTLVGTESGLVRPLTGVGLEAATAVLLTPSFDAGDVRAKKQWGDLYVEAETGSVK